VCPLRVAPPSRNRHRPLLGSDPIRTRVRGKARRNMKAAPLYARVMPLPKPEPPPLEWVDRHRLWRRILADYQAVKSRAPEGFRPVVLVFLRNRPEPLELGFVRTSRDSEFPWVRFELTKGVPLGAEADPLPPDAQWIYAHEDDVQRVEICLREAPPFDFDDFAVLEDEPEP
jgi:hypothetical protein